MKTHLPQLKAAIYRANTELADYVCRYCYRKFDSSDKCCIDCYNQKTVFEYIERHPIHLEHILRAIHASDPACVYLISHAGTFARFSTIGAKQYTDPVYADEEEKVPVIYNLAKSFEDQEPETLEFLYQLLCKE